MSRYLHEQSLTWLQLNSFLNFLPTFGQLRTLELWADTLELRDVDGGPSETARWIMGSLHFLKIGVPFGLITMHLNWKHTSTCRV
jgi:hypothetical protein